MNLIDKLSDTLAQFIVTGSNKTITYKPIEGIAQDIYNLKQLREEIKAKDEEIRRRKVEWDRTFDAIIDNIVIINDYRVITKVNKSFVQCVRDEGGSWTELIGMPWEDFHRMMGIPTEDECIVEKCFETKVPQERTFERGSGTYSICTNPIFDNKRNVISVVRVSRDITKYEAQKKTLARRSRLFAAISQMSRTLTNHDNWENALDDILKELGEAVGAHRVYIFDNVQREERLCAELSGVWVNPETNDCVSGANLTDCINYDTIPSLRDSMEHGNTIQTTIPQCDICPERLHCICSEDVIVSAVPIFANKVWWGFIGFDYHNGHRKFKNEDETILRIAADIIGGVIYRRRKYFESLDKKD